MPSTPPRQTTVVVNHGSRRGREALAEVSRLLDASRLGSVQVLPVEAGGDLRATLRTALAEGPDLLVVGGGDGTISCAADVVAGTDVVLGVLPLGTANDFARTLEVPTDLPGAVGTLVSGKVVDVDLGRIDGRAFLNVASIGLSVGVTERLTPTLKRRLGPLAYPVATLLAYRHHAPFSARLELPDGEGEAVDLDDLLQVAVGNGRHYGGGNAVSPTASLDDHRLDVYAIVRGRLHEHVSIARLLRSGHLIEHERVHHVTTRRVRVVTDPPLPVNLDGEIVTTTPATFEVQRNALHVMVPRTSGAATFEGRSRGAGSTPPP